MKITINKETLLNRIEEDGTVVSRVPGTNTYLYLEAEDILSIGEKTIVAELEETKHYTIGGKKPDSPVGIMRGDELYREHYMYSQAADHTVKSEPRRHQKTAGTDRMTEQLQPNGSQQIHATVSNQTYNREQFRQIRLGQKHNLDVSQYWNIKLSAEQMMQLRLMQEQKIDISAHGYNHPSIPVDVLEELRKGHQAGYNMNRFDWRNMKVEQIRELRIGLEHHIDAKQYAYAIYSADQMKQMRLGMQNHIDIEQYRNPHYSAKQMKEMRIRLVVEEIKQKIHYLWENFKEMLKESALYRLKDKIFERVTEGLDKSVEVLSGEKAINFMLRQEVPTQSLEEKINETVQDIKELLVAQELVPEKVLYDKEMAASMNQKIHDALDQLMQPDTIQSVSQQEQIISEAAEEVIRETGADIKPEDEAVRQKETELGADISEVDWNSLSDFEKMEQLSYDRLRENEWQQMHEEMEP